MMEEGRVNEEERARKREKNIKKRRKARERKKEVRREERKRRERMEEFRQKLREWREHHFAEMEHQTRIASPAKSPRSGEILIPYGPQRSSKQFTGQI